MRWKCRCRTRASPWTYTARSLVPVIKDIFMPLKTFSSNVTNAMPVKCSEQPLWGLPSPQLRLLILSECCGGGRPLLGGGIESLRDCGNAGFWTKWKEPKCVSSRILSSFLTVVQPQSCCLMVLGGRSWGTRQETQPSTPHSPQPFWFPSCFSEMIDNCNIYFQNFSSASL